MGFADIDRSVLGREYDRLTYPAITAAELIAYPYWCIEKGYARWVGPNDGSDAWRRRARGWMKVMYKDATLSMAIYTFATVAFYIMGAAVLKPQGLMPRGNAMITTLARMYTDALGPWAMRQPMDSSQARAASSTVDSVNGRVTGRPTAREPGRRTGSRRIPRSCRRHIARHLPRSAPPRPP